MGARLRLVWAGLILFCAIALGASDNDSNLPEKQVYPLTKQEDVWWAGIRDMCRITGATVSGPWIQWGPVILKGFEAPGDDDLFGGGFGGIIVQSAKSKGPIKITVGEDTYTFNVGSTRLEKNEERVWDLLHEPKWIKGEITASLEDLSKILDFTLEDEIEGQPTITHLGKRYRLVQGKPRWSVRRFLEPLRDVFRGPHILKRYDGGTIITLPRVRQPGYVMHNGALYQQGTVGILGPTMPTPGSDRLLYGPVVPGQYRAENVSADQLFLSIVRIPQPRTGVVWRPTPFQDPR